MSELIDAACDICGHKYRWSEDRLGKTAACRECGTSFEVAVYVPPPDDEEADLNNPLPWIKGAGVAALIMLVLAGLGSLLIYRPADARKAGLVVNHPVAPMVPMQGPGIPNPLPVQVPGLTPGQMPVPQMPVPQVPAQQMPVPTVSPQSTPQPPAFSPGARSAATPPAAVQASPPIPPAPRGLAKETTVVAADANALEKTAVPPPKPTGWSLFKDRGQILVRLTGSGLKEVTQVQELLGPALREVQHRILSDTELEFHAFSARPDRDVLIALHAGSAMALVFPTTVNTVTAQETVQGAKTTQVCYLRKGAKLKGLNVPIAMMEAGASGEFEGIGFLCFMQAGADLQCMIVNTLYAEPGARVTTTVHNQLAPKVQRSILFYPLAPLQAPPK